MFIPVVFALVASLSGLAVHRGLRLAPDLAPFTGLAALIVVTRWAIALGVAPWASSGVAMLLALAGLATLLSARRPALAALRACRVPALLVSVSALIPAVLLAVLFAAIETPVSNHDGAFHVQTVDSLRRGAGVPSWYPIGFHSVAAAVLGLVPWLDSARGTAEIGQGIVLLAPIAVFALGLGLGMTPLQASVGAVVQALTFIFPYDNHLWGGWPFGASLLLLIALWAVGARWITTPSWPLAAVAGLLAGAIVLTHGTEVYSAIIGLAVIAAFNWRRIRLTQLARHLPLALGVAVLCVLPYASALFTWTTGGGATVFGTSVVESGVAHGERGSAGDWLEFVLSITGAAGFIDLPLRSLMLALGARVRQLAVVVAAWATFSALLFAVSFVPLAPINWLFVVTFPWLVHHRPPQLVIVFACLLVGAGLVWSVDWLRALRPRLATRPRAWRRIVIACAILLGFFAEGSAVTVYKTVDEVIAHSYIFSADDRRAMTWLRQHARPGEMVVNDQAADAGIWAPYKAPVSILLPRSPAPALVEERQPILTNLLDLGASPTARARACALHVGYVYYGARVFPDEARQLPDRGVLERAPTLEAVFASGDAAIYRIRVPCG